MPVDGLHVPTSWHWSWAVQVTGFVPVQVPAWHVSVRVHALLSSHVVPFGLAGFEHAPVDGLHVPASWHWSWAVQETAFVPVRMPASHVSVRVHALLSSPVAPFGLAAFEHAPVDALHVPTPWHCSWAVQVTGFAPLSSDPWHVSVRVHALLSSHVVPFGFAGFEHTPVDESHFPAS